MARMGLRVCPQTAAHQHGKALQRHPPSKRKARAASPKGPKAKDGLHEPSKPPAKRASPSKRASSGRSKPASDPHMASFSGFNHPGCHAEASSSDPGHCRHRQQQPMFTEGGSQQAMMVNDSSQQLAPEPLLARLQRLAASGPASACMDDPLAAFPAPAAAGPSCMLYSSRDVYSADTAAASSPCMPYSWDVHPAAADATIPADSWQKVPGLYPAGDSLHSPAWQCHLAEASPASCSDFVPPQITDSSPATGRPTQLGHHDTTLDLDLATASSPVHGSQQQAQGTRAHDHDLTPFLTYDRPSTPLQPSSPGIIIIEDTPLPPVQAQCMPTTSAADSLQPPTHCSSSQQLALQPGRTHCSGAEHLMPDDVPAVASAPATIPAAPSCVSKCSTRGQACKKEAALVAEASQSGLSPIRARPHAANGIGSTRHPQHHLHNVQRAASDPPEDSSGDHVSSRQTALTQPRGKDRPVKTAVDMSHVAKR